MTSTNMTQVREAIGKAFAKIGNTNGSAALPTGDNVGTIVHEYYVASVLESLAKKRRENARDGLDDAGVTADVDKCKAGDTKVLYDGDNISLSVNKKMPASRLDATALRVELLKIMSEAEVLKIIVKCTKENAPATSLICSSK